jgi:hypothetical protein
MNLRMGSQLFFDVTIPLLWGTRAVLQDRKGRLSVIDLSEPKARVEVLGDEPAPGIEYKLTADGFTVLGDAQSLYNYKATEKLLQAVSLRLPDCQITPAGTRIGRSYFSGNVISGYGVGIAVTDTGLSVGAPLPPGLARLVV